MIGKSFESCFCLSVWTVSVIYSLYKFYLGTKEIEHFFDPNEFDQGWFLGRKRDTSDDEWLVFREATKESWFLILGYIAIYQVVWQLTPQFTLSAIIVYGSFVIGYILSPIIVAFVWLNVFLAFAIDCSKLRPLSYLLCLTSFYLLHGSQFTKSKRVLLDHDFKRILLFDVLIAWLNAKCLSFVNDRNLELRQYGDDNYTMALAYCLYFPTLFTGPIHQYSVFLQNMVNRPAWSYQRFLFGLVRLGRFIFWAIIYEIMIHFLYSSSVQYYPTFTVYFDSWTLCGLGYCLPCLFHVKYFVLYGFAWSLSNLDAIEIPPPPKCVTRIHLSSWMWRYFDRGLYLWLLKYFYRPIVKPGSGITHKIIATLVCFICVWLWHGSSDFVTVWCSLNFLGVLAELLGSTLRQTEKIAAIENRLSPQAKKRIRSAIASPFYLLLIVSNIFFLSNYELGKIFVHRILLGFPLPIVTILLIMYCACYVSIEFMENS